MGLMESLLVAGGSAPPELATPEAVELDWALSCGLGPWLLHHHPVAARDWPPALRDRLLASALTARAEAAARNAVLDEVVDLAGRRNARLVLLKGVSTSQQLYPLPHLRTMGDIDLLLDPDAVAAIHEELRRRGYRQDSRATAERFSTHHHAVPLQHPDSGVWLELHTGLFPGGSPLSGIMPFRPGDFWDLVEQVEGPRWRFLPELQLVYTASHWANQYKPQGAALGLLDLALLLGRHGVTMDWTRIDRWCGANPLLAWHLSLALSTLRQAGVPLPSTAGQRLQRASSAERLVLAVFGKLARHCLLRGPTTGRWSSPANLRIVWEGLAGPGSSASRLLRLPVALAFPASRPDRFSPALIARRLGALLGRR